MTVAAAAVVPLAAGLYLVTTTAWTVVENRLLRVGVPADDGDRSRRPPGSGSGGRR